MHACQFPPLLRIDMVCCVQILVVVVVCVLFNLVVANNPAAVQLPSVSSSETTSRQRSFFPSLLSPMMFSAVGSSATVLPPVPIVPTTGNKQILISGGAGYIGTHTIVCLLEAGYDVTVVDNLVNSNEESLRRVQDITACDPNRIRFYNVDICNPVTMEHVFATSPKFEGNTTSTFNHTSILSAFPTC